jgi:hypothetical protein
VVDAGPIPRVADAQARPSRRAFIRRLARLGTLAAGVSLVGGCGILNGGRAQPSLSVGYLLTDSHDSSHNYAQIVHTLGTLGWVEGQNIRYEWRFTDGHAERFPELALELVELPVDVIIASDRPGVVAAVNASHAIPVASNLGNPPRTCCRAEDAMKAHRR